MEPVVAEIVDWTALGETALSALVAGVFVTLTFSLAIYGSTKAADLRREGRGVESALAGVLGGLALLVSLAAVALGLFVMVS